jgi:hypothetical protein
MLTFSPNGETFHGELHKKRLIARCRSALYAHERHAQNNACPHCPVAQNGTSGDVVTALRGSARMPDMERFVEPCVAWTRAHIRGRRRGHHRCKRATSWRSGCLAPAWRPTSHYTRLLRSVAIPSRGPQSTRRACHIYERRLCGERSGARRPCGLLCGGRSATSDSWASPRPMQRCAQSP